MNDKKVLIVTDADNRGFWETFGEEIERKISLVQIVLDTDILKKKHPRAYDYVLVDVSNIDDLHRLIPRIHRALPRSRIVVISSTPTWKQTREAIRLGAASLLRKTSKTDEIIDELLLL